MNLPYTGSNIPGTKSHVPLSLLRSYQSISPGPRLYHVFHNMLCFNREELLAPHPTTNLEDHPLSAVRDCLFNIFTAILHIGGHSSIRNLRMHHALVQGLTYHMGTVWNNSYNTEEYTKIPKYNCNSPVKKTSTFNSNCTDIWMSETETACRLNIA
jgi:hypothetical protein